MSFGQEEHPRPGWCDDHLESPCPHEWKPPYFDEKLGAWVLSRYTDVLAAFRDPNLVPAGAKNGRGESAPDESARSKMRAETKAALSLRQLRKWQKILTPEVNALTQRLPTSHTVDLVGEFAKPLCLTLAVNVSGADPSDAERLGKLARHISASAADPYDPKLHANAARANSRLRGCFHAGPETLRDSTFVALSHTVPSLLANAWFALLRHPEQWMRLHERPSLTAQAIEELLRYAGLTRLLFRRAVEDVNLKSIRVRKGDRLVLRITMANKDPQRFEHPDAIDLVRRDRGQLAFGAGPHACVGANLIRMASITITRPLVERFAHAELVETVDWHGGSIFRAPVSLPVRLREAVS